MTNRIKTLKYQSRYFERDIPKNLFRIEMSSNGSFELIDESTAVDRSSVIYLFIGVTGIVFNLCKVCAFTNSVKNHSRDNQQYNARVLLINSLILTLVQKLRNYYCNSHFDKI